MRVGGEADMYGIMFISTICYLLADKNPFVAIEGTAYPFLFTAYTFAKWQKNGNNA